MLIESHVLQWVIYPNRYAPEGRIIIPLEQANDIPPDLEADLPGHPADSEG